MSTVYPRILGAGEAFRAIGRRTSGPPATAGRATEALIAEALAAEPPRVPDPDARLSLPVLEDEGDRPVDLTRVFEGRAVLVALYLGGWSAPCLRALGRLEAARGALADRGVDVVGVSAEAVDRLALTRAGSGAGFLLVHDHGARFAAGLGLALRLAQPVRAALRADGVSLGVWNGEASHAVARPATLLVAPDRSATAFLPATPATRSDIDAALAAALA